MNRIERGILAVIFVLSAGLAFFMLKDAQNATALQLNFQEVRNLTVIGTLCALMSLASGFGLTQPALQD